MAKFIVTLPDFTTVALEKVSVEYVLRECIFNRFGEQFECFEITSDVQDKAARIPDLLEKLNSAHDDLATYRCKSSELRVALEDSLNVLANVASATLSKKLSKFVDRRRKILDSSES